MKEVYELCSRCGSQVPCMRSMHEKRVRWLANENQRLEVCDKKQNLGRR